MSTDLLFILSRDHSFLMKFFRVHFLLKYAQGWKPDLTSTPPWCLLPSHQTPLNLLISRREKRSSSSIIGKCVLQVPTTSKDEVLCFFSAAAAATQCSTVEKTTAEQSCFAFANELSHNLLEEEAFLLRIALAGMDLLTATVASQSSVSSWKSKQIVYSKCSKKPKLRSVNIFLLLLRPKVQFLFCMLFPFPPIIANWETQWTRKSHPYPHKP